MFFQEQNFSPKASDFRLQQMTVEELMGMITANKLDVEVAFRKKTKQKGKLEIISKEDNSEEWDWQQQQDYIIALLCGVPASGLFIDGCEAKWYVVDGRERLWALCRFIRNGLVLEQRDFDVRNVSNDAAENNLFADFLYARVFRYKHFSDMPAFARQKILNISFPVTIVNPGTSSTVRWGLYSQMAANKIDREVLYHHLFGDAMMKMAQYLWDKENPAISEQWHALNFCTYFCYFKNGNVARRTWRHLQATVLELQLWKSEEVRKRFQKCVSLLEILFESDKGEELEEDVLLWDALCWALDELEISIDKLKNHFEAVKKDILNRWNNYQEEETVEYVIRYERTLDEIKKYA